ncbi:hypothetical protein H0H92_007822 [Tricholoma furcatifolium]|nr:hypothetical protein H0H92_007822 [Tricholoma furcatifolium]
MPVVGQFFALFSTTIIAWIVYKTVQIVWHHVTSPLRDIPGPTNSSWVYGNMKDIWAAEKAVLREKWVEKYGPSFQYRGLLSRRRLYTIDTKALNHILMNSDIYQKPEVIRYNLGRLLGGAVRELTESFFVKAIELRDIWKSQITAEDEKGHIDALSWLNRATLDIIGLAGFNYKFDALSEDSKVNELNNAFATMLKATTTITQETDQDVRAGEARKTMLRIGNELLRESKASIHDKGMAKDLLTLMNKAVQTKLRQELMTVDTDYPTMDQLNALPYLDMVVREALRIHAPAPSTMRVAVKDDVLPLSCAIVDRKGVKHDTIKISKGQTFLIPIVDINCDKSIWGEDGREFRFGPVVYGLLMRMTSDRPERWEEIPDAATRIPGAWGNILSFLGGPRTCIGWRFSLVEMKVLLFTIIRTFELDLAVPVTDITKKGNIVQRPVLSIDGSNQMPLHIRLITKA